MKTGTTKDLKNEENKSIFKSFMASSQFTLILGIIVLSVIITIGNPLFLSVTNLKNILISVAVSGIMVTGLTVAMLADSMDISQYSLGAFGAMLMGYLLTNMNVPFGIAVILVLALGIVCGMFNGLIVTKLGIAPFIGTLGASYIYRSAAYIITDSKSIILKNNVLNTLSLGNTLHIPNTVLVMIVCFVFFYFLLKYTPFGRMVYAVGGNPKASRLSGIKVTKIKMIAMILSAVTAVLGGMLNAGQVTAAIPTQGNGMDLDNVVAVILGGVSIAGGGGHIIGTFLGVLFMGILKNGMTLLNIQSYYQTLARGVILILAVYLDILRRKHHK